MNDSSSERVAERKKPSWLDLTIRLVKEKPLGTAGAVITLLLLFTGIFADFLAPYGMNEVNIEHVMVPPSAKFWLGTDNVGRDMLSRIIFGARISVIVGVVGSISATLVSSVIGVLSGYIGGKFDLIVQRFVDAWMCFPALILMLVIIAVIGSGLWHLIITFAIVWGIFGSRIVRSAVIGIKENVYIDAAKAAGCSTTRILIRHILPNIMAPLIILFTTRVPSIIMTEASLSFLGFGLPPPVPSWGGMIGGMGRIHMLKAPWMAVLPGLALASVVYGINMFGDALRDLLDPRLRGGIGRYGVRVKKEAK